MYTSITIFCLESLIETKTSFIWVFNKRLFFNFTGWGENKRREKQYKGFVKERVKRENACKGFNKNIKLLKAFPFR